MPRSFREVSPGRPPRCAGVYPRWHFAFFRTDAYNKGDPRQPYREGWPMDEPDRNSEASPLTPEQIFRDYAPRVYNLARRMLGNDADAEDVTQEVLLQVVR